MYKTTLTVCASKVIQDVTTNTISVVDVYEEFNAPGLPFVIPNFSIVWTLEKEAGDSPTPAGFIRIQQGDQELGRFPLNINFQVTLRSRSILVLGGLVISQLSPVIVEFHLNEILVSTLSFPVKVTPAPVTSPPTHS